MSILLGLLNTVIVVLCLFLIGVILIQRGKGGGLAGAFGGAGGSSAFGTKAGDVFTRITAVTALIWIALSMMLVFLTNQHHGSAFDSGEPSSAVKASAKTPAKSGTGSSASKNAETTKAPAPSSSTSKSTANPDIPTDLPAIPDLPAPK